MPRLREVQNFVRKMERAINQALATFGIAAQQRADHAGAFVHGAKIASIGAAVRAGVTYHGLALDVCTDLAYFQLINPCGMPGVAVTSIARELGREVSVQEAKAPLRDAMIDVYGLDVRPGPEWSGRIYSTGVSMIARKPEWLKVKLPAGDNYVKLRGIVKDRGLHTVCQEAMCPNIAECWGVGTATFMILGDTCTRGCRFCNVKTGKPYELDPLEAIKLAKSIEDLHLNYAVITCVDRDDLPDGGAQQMADAIRAIRHRTPHVKVEVLTSDYRGDEAALKKVIDADPDVFAHNIETTRALTPHVRDRRCGYDQSLQVLLNAKSMRRG